ncbi:MAG: hypothetical protein RL518_975 [Pseudomonadota bacterium]|jgi:hypothetical protein
MSWRHTGLSVITLLTFLGMKIPPLLARPPETASSWFVPPSHEDPEGRLAMGDTLALECLNVWSAELIKGVSDKLALELLDKRFAVMRAATTSSPLEAIQSVPGVGEKTAHRLLEYLDLRGRCETQERFEMWRHPGGSRKAPFPVFELDSR